MSTSAAIDTVIEVAALRSRAHDLRARAAATDPVLAVAYRRRSAELELQALAEEARAGIVSTVERVLAAA
ncbi:MAG: hypothetical protein ACE5GB_03520 [Acidimicrobiales bacterium]